MAGDIEPSFASMFSPLTLQTDKRGFFLPYADNVIEIAGSAWLKNVFGKLKTDQERIKILFSETKLREAVHAPLDGLQPRRRPKDAVVAGKALQEGARALESQRPRHALQMLSQAVVRAPHPALDPAAGDTGSGGGELAVALAARAEALETLREYSLALRDLRAADKLGHPTLPRFQLLWRMARCHRGLQQPQRAAVALRAAMALLGAAGADNDKAKAHGARVLADDLAAAEAAAAADGPDAPEPPDARPAPPELTGGPGSLPGAARGVGVGSSDAAGRFAVATAPVAAGDTLLVETPLAACLLPDYCGSHCHHCMRPLLAPVACGACAGLAYCSDACARAAAPAHAVECPLADVLLASGMSILCRVALRLAAQAPGAGAFFDPHSAQRLKDDPAWAAYAAQLSRLESLVTHAERRPPEDMMQRSLMALLLLKMLQKAGFFARAAPPAQGEALSGAELRVGALLLRWLQLLQFNAHEVYETRMLARGRFRGAKPVYVGVAIYPSAALCNHECYPGLARYFVGTTLVLRALRPLRAGDALAENYGPAFVKFPLAARKKALLSRYWFNCTCQACCEDWPVFEHMDNGFRYRCSTKGCSQLVRLSQDVLEQPQQQQQGSKKKKKQPQPPPQQASVKCKGCQRRVGVAEAAREVQEAERTYADALDRMEAGDAQGAVPLFCAYVDRLHALGHPPRKNLHLAQEALRICMADAGNTWVAPDKE
ncbi:hypothetical protein R5R35_009420 [Gryllus longicercus]|uniref:MYND-type domain-containing protein n=1 Tax=Gryllus longicercus TaxID=2509291 RepID=A0AAN9VM66_9ORTH